MEGEQEVTPSRLTKRQSGNPLPVTSAHTENGVMADEGREPPKVIPRMSNKQSRQTKRTAAKQGVAKKAARVKPIQNGPERSNQQTHKSVPASQPAPGGEKDLAVSPSRLTQTHSGESTGQSAPANGRRPAITPDEPTRICTGDTTGQGAPVAGKRPAGGSERPS